MDDGGSVMEKTPAPDPSEGTATPERKGVLRRLVFAVPWGIVGPVLSLALFGGALYVLATILNKVNPDDVLAAFSLTPVSAFGLSILFTFFSYLALTGYDGLALRQIGARNIPYSMAAVGSFTSYAISYTLGFPLLTAGTVRYRVYGAAGLTAPQIAALTLVCTLTFWLGMASVLGVGLILVPDAVAYVDHLPRAFNMAIGAVLVLAVIAYVVFVSTRRRVVTVEGWSLPLPGGRVTSAQIVLGAFDVAMGAAALYVLLPGHAPVDFWTFTVIYVLAAILGVVSHAPGGIGVFEATILIALPDLPRDALLGSLLLFRVIYYFVPFTLALVILAAYEIARRRHLLARLVDQAADIARPVAPILVGGAVFVAGAGLLITGSLPLGPARRDVLQAVFPLSTVEAAHNALAVFGVALLFLARGLIRRLNAAWIVAGVILASCAVLVFPRGGDWRLAGLMAGLLLVLLLSRSAFGRDAPLVSARFSPWWLGAVATVLAGSIWLGLVSHRLTLPAPELWISAAFDADDARFLRGAVLACLTAIGILFVSGWLRRQLRPTPRPTDNEVERIVLNESAPEARLALTPDKQILVHSTHDALLAFARQGRSLIALGDPLGERAYANELIWAFREQAETMGRHPVLLGVTPAARSACLDAGLSLTHVGEAALIDLTQAKAGGAGAAGFAVAFLDETASPVDVIAQAVAWRGGAMQRDPFFVKGPLDAEWLMRARVALLNHDGTTVGLAVILEGASGARWLLDTVRLDPAIQERFGVEPVLTAFIEGVVRLARAEGAQELSLGLTPVGGLDQESLEPTWARVSPQLYGLGNLMGDRKALRGFCERFATRFEPRDLACPGGWALPQILLDITALIERGPRG